MFYCSNCKYFTGYKPCQYDSNCRNCSHFEPDAIRRILIIKANQLGNIVKTTPILHALNKPNTHITWLASEQGCKLLANNNKIDELLVANLENFWKCEHQQWDLVLSLEANAKLATLATAVKSHSKTGYGIDQCGKLCSLHASFDNIFHAGVSNQFRFKENTKTLAEMYYYMLGEKYNNQLPILCPSKANYADADAFLKTFDKKPYIGLNTGGNSDRFPTKNWPENNWIELIRLLRKQFDCSIFLLGGPCEMDMNRKLAEWTGAINIQQSGGCLRSWDILSFVALLDRMDCVVSSDSFGMQAAMAMKTPVVGLFGPTPMTEIEVYNNGIKLCYTADCSPCYIRKIEECPHGWPCMDSILPQLVCSSVVELATKEKVK